MIRSLAIALVLWIASAPLAEAATLLDFGATWCGPCRQVAPQIDALIAKGYEVRKIDVDREPELAAKYGITAIPAFVVVDADGNELARRIGPASAAELAKLYNDAANRQIKAGVSRGTAGGDPRPSYHFDEASGHPPPWSTVVRIRAKLAKEAFVGTGTVIDGKPDSSLVLTCAHVLHDGADLSVEVFGPSIDARGKAVGGWTAAFPASFVDKDVAADVGLIRFKPGRELPASPLVDTGWQPSPAEPLCSVGCSLAGDPTTRSERFLESRTFQSKNGPYAAFACAALPKEGRSGGGLFDQLGRLVGLCDFATPQEGTGLYAATSSLRAILERNGLVEMAAGVPRKAAATPEVTKPSADPEAARPDPPAVPTSFFSPGVVTAIAGAVGVPALGLAGWIGSRLRGRFTTARESKPPSPDPSRKAKLMRELVREIRAERDREAREKEDAEICASLTKSIEEALAQLPKD